MWYGAADGERAYCKPIVLLIPVFWRPTGSHLCLSDAGVILKFHCRPVDPFKCYTSGLLKKAPQLTVFRKLQGSLRARSRYSSPRNLCPCFKTLQSVYRMRAYLFIDYVSREMWSSEEREMPISYVGFPRRRRLNKGASLRAVRHSDAPSRAVGNTRCHLKQAFF